MLQVVVPCVCMLYSWFSHILYPWGLTAAPSIRFYCVMPWAHKTETRFCVWGRGLQKRDLCWWQSFLWGYDLKTVYNACSGRNDTLLNGCLALKRYKTPCKERLAVVPGVGWGSFLNLTWPCSQEATRWHIHMCLKQVSEVIESVSKEGHVFSEHVRFQIQDTRNKKNIQDLISVFWYWGNWEKIK